MSKSEGTVLTSLSSPQKLRGSQGHFNFRLAGYKFRGSLSTLSLLEVWLYYSKMVQIRTRDTEGKVWEGSKYEACSILRETHPSFGLQSGSHYLGMTHWIIAHIGWIQFLTTTLPLIFSWYFMVLSHNFLIKWLIFLVWPCPCLESPH